MTTILFNFLNGEVIATHISGKIYNFAKVDQALESAKKAINETTQTKFSLDFDVSTTICVYVMESGSDRPLELHRGVIFPIIE